MKVDRLQNIRMFNASDGQPAVQFNLAPGYVLRYVQLACCRGEVFLQHLRRDHRLIVAPAGIEQIGCCGLFVWIGGVVTIQKDVRVEETPLVSA